MAKNEISQVAEDIKWTIFGSDEYSADNIFGFNPSLKFVSWTGDGKSFIVRNGEDEYVVSVEKRSDR